MLSSNFDRSWTAPRFSALFGILGRLRIVGVPGASVSETVRHVGPAEISSPARSERHLGSVARVLRTGSSVPGAWRGFGEGVGLRVLVCWMLLGLVAVAAKAEPTRVATLTPLAEEVVELIPEQAELVATVRRHLHEPVGPGMIDLGNPHSPSFEALAQSRPEVVVGDRMLHAALARKLEPMGMKLILMDGSGVVPTLNGMKDLASQLGDDIVIRERVAGLESDLSALAIDQQVEVLLLFGSPGSFYVVTERAWLGDLIVRLGFVNLAPAGGSERMPGFVPVTDEVIASMTPDLVAMVAHGDPAQIEANLRRRTNSDGPWASLGRARYGIHVLDPSIFSSNPGLGLAEAGRGFVSLMALPASATGDP
ncbi:ABC transporter substrate-binding protein [Myxococcota bacterium]|nr:ABC transporter substrate-binding protein [Myxococcota bacterium]